MAVPSGVSVNPSGWIPTRVSLRPNRRSPFGAARFLIDVGEWVGEFSVKSVRNRYTADVYRSPSTPAPSVLSKKRRTHHTSLSKHERASSRFDEAQRERCLCANRASGRHGPRLLGNL